MTRTLPLPFHDRAMRKVLSLEKTETRRPVRPRPVYFVNRVDGRARPIDGDRTYRIVTQGPKGTQRDKDILCPYGAPGDLLWVREAWRVVQYQDSEDHEHGLALIEYRARGRTALRPLSSEQDKKWETRDEHDGWRPSVHMPKWACRCLLHVDEVYAERLQDITFIGYAREGYGDFEKGEMRTKAFKESWDQTYAPGWKRWSENPWVWVVRFRVDWLVGPP